MWLRVKAFSADNESAELAQKPILVPRAYRAYLFWGVIGIILCVLVLSLIIYTNIDQSGIFGSNEREGLLDLLLLLFIGSVGSLIYGAVKLPLYHLSKRKKLYKLTVGIIGKDYIPVGPQQFFSSGYFSIAFINAANHRNTFELDKSQVDLVSVGDVGILAIRAGRVIGFLRSSRFSA
jgi:hypothetical protein